MRSPPGSDLKASATSYPVMSGSPRSRKNFGLVRSSDRHGFVPGHRRSARVSATLEERRDQLDDVGLVIDDKNPRGVHSVRKPGARREINYEATGSCFILCRTEASSLSRRCDQLDRLSPGASEGALTQTSASRRACVRASREAA